MQRPAAWEAYEQAIMAGRGDEAPAPGEDYVMSDAFRDWLVEKLRHEVLGDVGMAILKDQPTKRSNP